MTQAGERFRCGCCREEHDQMEASFDDQFNAPICSDCKKQIIKAVAWLKAAKITRPVNTADINEYNHKRFEI
jgi:hypothetical protein